MRKLFEKWLNDNLLSFENQDFVYFIAEKTYLLLDLKNEKIIDNKFSLILSAEEKALLQEEIDFVVFLWGDKFYYTPSDKIKNPQFNVLRYIGQRNQDEIPFLGIHGKYELLNGSRGYSEWCKKAKFLNIKTLGICEKNTLAGTLDFQEECKKNGIKPILGETIAVRIESGTSSFIALGKVFVINETGWKNLLLINTEINVNNPSRYINELRLLELSEGLVFVFHPAYFPYDKNRVKLYSEVFLKCYFQLDTCQYNNEETDKQYLLNSDKYLKDSNINPILINDAYYLEKEDFEIKSTLNLISGERDLLSDSQWFKTYDEVIDLLKDLFSSEESFIDIMLKGVESLSEVEELCSFTIETGRFKLPQYKMTDEEKKLFSNNEELFFHLLSKNFEEKIINKGLDFEVYSERLEKEIDVIKKGGVIDYFLILWDVVRFCKENNILTGIGRGSAGGALTSYLLDIIRINPIEYKLLFERFLNEGRIKKSLPDIDLDVEGLNREKVKQYFEQKYGHDKFCSLGTYTSLMLKAAIKDISRTQGIEIPLVQKISNAIVDPKADWSELFNLSLSDPLLRKFISDNPKLINLIQLCHTQPRSASVHACATVLVPSNESIFTSIPIRKTEDGLLVSEWEGEFIEKAGYLKEDLLGLLQLDKFRMIIDLVKQNYNEDVDIYSIPLDEKEVYTMFQKALVGDVFQFGSKGLAPYLVQVKPEHIEDLIAINALYRPGPIEGNAHMEFIDLRHGDKQPVYYPKTEEITKPTYSLIVYQEQIMQICQTVGGLTLIEADDIRKILDKKKLDQLVNYKDKWFNNAYSNGYSEELAQELWDKMVAFGSYAFNRSHSAAYAITGYTCQYLKWKYPLPFWITALEHASEDNVLRYLSEISNSSTIEVAPPDINKSSEKFIADFSTNKILWSISKVKQCGPVAVQGIFEARNKNGQFFSLEEFLERVEKSKVNKSSVENLIIAGAFDELESIKFPAERRALIEEYRVKNNIKVDPQKDWFELNKSSKSFYEDWFWSMLQKQVSGLAFFDYVSLVQQSGQWNMRTFSTVSEIHNLLNADIKRKRVVTAGFIQEIEEKESKKGSWMKILIEQNYEFVYLYLWSDLYEKFAKDIRDKEGNILIFNGRVVFDTFKKENIIQAEEDFKIEILSKI